jgi:CheY-like chemotaxis protein
MPNTKCRVIVVDDDDDTAHTFALILVGMGHEATFLTDPAKVEEAVARIRPHIVFLDIGMPGLSGWDLAKVLRRQYPHDTLRLVAITGRSEPQAHARSRQAGFDAHVTKPVAVDLVESILQQLVFPGRQP